VVRNGATVSLFVNGTQTATYNYAATSLDGGVSANLYIGDAGGNDSATRFRGYISNLRVVNGSAVYTAAFTPPTAPLSTVTNTVLLTLASNYVRDLSTLNFATTASSGVSIQRFNPFGNTQTYAISSATIQGSTYFDGSTSYLTTPTGLATAMGGGWANNIITLEAWVYPTAYNSANSYYEAVMGYYQAVSGNGRWSWGYVGGATTTATMYFGYTTSVGAGNTLNSTATAAVLNSWSHIALVVNAVNSASTTVSMFANGSLLNTFTAQNFTTQGTYYSAPWIGWDNNQYTNRHTGYLSNVRVTTGAALYTGSYTVPTATLSIGTQTSLLALTNSQTITDISTYTWALAQNGTVSATLRTPFARNDTSTAATLYSGSVYFNGSTDYLNVASPNLSGSWTVEMWVYWTLGGTQTSMLNFNNGSWTGINFWKNTSNQLVIDDGSNAQSAFTTVIPAINAWNHIAAVRIGTTTYCYVNGVLAGSNTFTPGTISAVTIGRFNSNAYYFPGYISNLRVVNGQALYTTTFTPSTVPLTTSSQGSTSTALLIPGINAGIYDSTMENNLVTVGAAQINTTATTVKFGSGSVKFNGSTDYLTIPANTAFNFGTGNFTIEAWIYTTSSATQRIISYATGSSLPYEFLLVNSGSNVYLDFYDGTTDNSSGSNYVTQNAWVHVAVTRSGTTVYLFINGVVVGTYTGNSKNLTSTGALYIGTYKPSPTNYFSGYIDDLRITSGIARYTATFTPPTASFTDIQLVVSSAITTFTTATNIGTVTWGYNTATTRWGGLQEPTSPTNLTPMSIEDQANTATGYFSLPQGTTGQRPPNPQAGYMRYNTTLDSVEYYNFVTGWTTIP
jgi:hypothetical protein